MIVAVDFLETTWPDNQAPSQRVVGTIIVDGAKIWADPPSSDFLQRVMQDDAPDGNKEAWARGLPGEYDGAYLRAKLVKLKTP